MPTRTRTAPFWTDDAYDQDRASDGVSRYGVYLQQRADMFDDDDGPIGFAVSAWQVATVPIMSPGYVCRQPRIMSASAGWHQAGMLATVQLVVSRPGALRFVPGWRGWDVEDRFFYEPDSEALVKMPAMLPTVTLLVVVPAERLHVPSGPPTGEVDVADAKAAVKAVAVVLNQHLAPVLDALELATR